MNLTAEQVAAVESGQPVGYVINDTECVVLRKDVFDRMQHDYDDSEWTVEEMLVVGERTFDDADTAGPISP